MSLSPTGILTFLGVDDIVAARAFYENTLGLPFLGDEGGTLLFDLNGVPLRISPVENFRPQSFTVLGWTVADIDVEAARLIALGIVPLRYAGMPQDDNGIATLGAAKILWFTDPAGNVLSLTQS